MNKGKIVIIRLKNTGKISMDGNFENKPPAFAVKFSCKSSFFLLL